MKNLYIPRVCLLPVFVLLWMGTATASSYVSIVKVYDYTGEVEEIPMTNEEIQALRQEIMQEARLHMPAIALAKQNWKSAGEDGTYPRTAVKRRRFVKTTRFNSSREAEEYLDRRQASKEAFQTRKEERKKFSQSKSGTSRCPITGKRYNTKSNKKSYASSSKRDKEREQKREASRAKRQKRDDRAVDYYLEAMEEVRQKELERLKKVEEDKSLVQRQYGL